MVDNSSNGETTYRLFRIAGPNITAVLGAPRRTACVLLRRARCGGRQAGSSRTRNGTDGSCSWIPGRDGLHAGARGALPTAVLQFGRWQTCHETRTSSQRTWPMRATQRRGNCFHRRAHVIERHEPGRRQR